MHARKACVANKWHHRCTYMHAFGHCPLFHVEPCSTHSQLSRKAPCRMHACWLFLVMTGLQKSRRASCRSKATHLRCDISLGKDGVIMLCILLAICSCSCSCYHCPICSECLHRFSWYHDGEPLHALPHLTYLHKHMRKIGATRLIPNESISSSMAF